MGKIKAMILSFAGGAVFLSFEIYWIRTFSFATQSKPYTFGLVLGIYLAGLAFGALAPKLVYLRSRLSPLRILGLLYFLSTVLCYLTIPLTVWFSTRKFYGYWIGLAPLFLSAFLFGGIFPLLVKVSEINEDDAGVGVALLSGANIMGSLFGSLAAGFLMLDALPLAQASAASALLGLFCALTVIVPSGIRGTRVFPILAVLLTAGGVIFSNGLLHNEMYKKLMYMPRHKVIPPFKEVIENRSGVICLTDEGVVFGDGAYDGQLSTDLYPKDNSEIELAYLTFLFHPQPKRILVVGLATGAWTQVLVNGPNVESVTAIEINPGYLDLIGKNREVSSLLSNKKVDIIIDDGRRWLNANPDDMFDYIVLNTTFHWRNGATNLLSKEFMELVKSRLNPGGVALINTTGSKEVVATANEVFSHIAAYRIYLAVSDSVFNLDRERFSQIIGSFTIEGKKILDLSDMGQRAELEKYLKLNYLKAGRHWVDQSLGSSLITDNNMLTEFSY